MKKTFSKYLPYQTFTCSIFEQYTVIFTIISAMPVSPGSPLKSPTYSYFKFLRAVFLSLDCTVLTSSPHLKPVTSTTLGVELWHQKFVNPLVVPMCSHGWKTLFRIRNDLRLSHNFSINSSAYHNWQNGISECMIVTWNYMFCLNSAKVFL